MTTVISVRGRNRDELLADPRFIYVGRQCYGWPGSPWGNPFKVGMDFDAAFKIVANGSGWSGEPRRIVDAAEAVRFFSLYATVQAWNVHRPLVLRDKVLGCWCCNWAPGQEIVTPCHAIVLAQLVDGMKDTEGDPR